MDLVGASLNAEDLLRSVLVTVPIGKLERNMEKRIQTFCNKNKLGDVGRVRSGDPGSWVITFKNEKGWWSDTTTKFHV
uniref:Uncharacterized protein n=1 Tax=Callorhinchus milii TaxID=7868 RepID=A0A4W3GR97_CALMI